MGDAISKYPFFKKKLKTSLKQSIMEIQKNIGQKTGTVEKLLESP